MSPGREKFYINVESDTFATTIKQDIMTALLVLIQLKTDNLDVELDSLAKSDTQDLIKTATDNMKTQLDNLDILLSDSVFRDFHDQINTTSTSLTIDLTSDYSPASIRGQDFIVHNLGNTNITIAVDGESAKTVEHHDVFLFHKTEWYVLVLSNDGGNNVEITIIGDVLS